MSISENSKKSFFAYAAVMLFCMVFTPVYYRFSHGVRSEYLTWLWAVPAVLGVAPSVVRLFCPGIWDNCFVGCYLYNCGTAAIIVHTALKGIFEIAGTTSLYEKWIQVVGFIMLAAGAIVILVNAIINLSARKEKNI